MLVRDNLSTFDCPRVQLQSVMAYTSSVPDDRFDKDDVDELRSWLSRGPEVNPNPQTLNPRLSSLNPTP